MIKLAFCVHRRPGMAPAEFHERWEVGHGPLVAQHAELLGIRRYVQSHSLVDPVNARLGEGRGAPAAFDGIAELWWDDLSALQRAAQTDEGRRALGALQTDETHFIDHARSPLFIVEE